MIKIAIPKLDVLFECWGEVAPHIQKAIEQSNGELEMSAVIDKITSGEILIAVVFKDSKVIAACSFEMFDFDSGKKVLQILGAGGTDCDLWFEEIDKIATDLAKVQGCDSIYITGRKGWERKMKNLDYKHIHTIIGKEVH